MRRWPLPLRKDDAGVGAVEFALIAPLLFAAIIGVAQLGMLFYANAGLRNAVGEGARYATIYPRPTDTQIRTRIASKKFGLKPQYLSNPTIVSGTSNSTNYVDITMSYAVPLDFIFFTVPAVTLTETRRAYVQQAPSP